MWNLAWLRGSTIRTSIGRVKGENRENGGGRGGWREEEKEEDEEEEVGDSRRCSLSDLKLLRHAPGCNCQIGKHQPHCVLFQVPVLPNTA